MDIYIYIYTDIYIYIWMDIYIYVYVYIYIYWYSFLSIGVCHPVSARFALGVPKKRVLSMW